MKLLKLKLYSKFRGLPEGFELNFRTNNYLDGAINEPICLVGLNGSGKSNTLEAIAEIFYYLELKTITRGKDLERLDERYLGLGFKIHYSITSSKWQYAYSRSVESLPFGNNTDIQIACSKEPDKQLYIFAYSAAQPLLMHGLGENIWQEVLPTNIIGYSSGQNELISNPFIKLDYYYFDEFVKSTSDKNVFTNTGFNRMFFMDYESNELVVLANYLFQDKDSPTWKDRDAFNQKLRIKYLHSFSLKIKFKAYDNKVIEFPSELNLGMERLKQCATAWTDNKKGLNDKSQVSRVIEFSFFIDDVVKAAFKDVFKTSFELFRILYLFRLMNLHCFSPSVRNSIKAAPQGTNLNDLVPKPPTEDLLFKITEIRFIKQHVKDPVSYKQLSDGEHQLLHVIGTLRLMQENDVLFILDEPETHFNPEWRAKLINLIMTSNKEEETQQDYFITSHSPFIISDCKPNNVYIFNRIDGILKVETAAQKRLNTFGTSVSILTEEVFNKNDSQGDYSLNKLNEIKNRKFNSLDAVQQAKEDSRVLGDSVEKTLLFRKLLMIEEELINQQPK